MANSPKSDIKDVSLAKVGLLRIEWAGRRMPVLKLINDEFRRKRPFKNLIVGALLHVTAETANLIYTLQAGGATVVVCAANSHSTQDEVAAALVKISGVSVFAIKGEDSKTYDKHVQRVLDFRPDIFIDDGADLTATYVSNVQSKKRSPWPVMGASEETTTGMHRLRAMENENLLPFPVIAVNDSKTKRMFDNRYGTGQSTIDAILRSTEILLAGKRVVVGGYGWCGRGVAIRARGMGASVTVTEVDSVKALEALMDGFRVMPMKSAVIDADLVITATGGTDVVTLKEALLMKDGAILANAGHFYVEFDYYGIAKACKSKKVIKEFVEEFTLPNGKRLFVLGEGRLINLVAAKGHPADVMDMSFANQALAANWFVQNKGKAENRIYLMPNEIDNRIASLKLESMEITIDSLSRKQINYLESWE